MENVYQNLNKLNVSMDVKNRTYLCGTLWWSSYIIFLLIRLTNIVIIEFNFFFVKGVICLNLAWFYIVWLLQLFSSSWSIFLIVVFSCLKIKYFKSL